MQLWQHIAAAVAASQAPGSLSLLLLQPNGLCASHRNGLLLLTCSLAQCCCMRWMAACSCSSSAAWRASRAATWLRSDSCSSSAPSWRLRTSSWYLRGRRAQAVCACVSGAGGVVGCGCGCRSGSICRMGQRPHRVACTSQGQATGPLHGAMNWQDHSLWPLSGLPATGASHMLLGAAMQGHHCTPPPWGPLLAAAPTWLPSAAALRPPALPPAAPPLVPTCASGASPPPAGGHRQPQQQQQQQQQLVMCRCPRCCSRAGALLTGPTSDKLPA
jgi:hypothetical protein